MNKKQLSCGILIVLLLAFGLSGCTKKPEVTAPVEGAQAPDFKITTLAGNTVSLQELLDEPVILTFWRTDSPPSRRELRNLTELKTELGDKVNILAINVGENKKTIEVFLKDNKVNVPVGLDTDKGPITNTYRIDYMPTTFVLDDNGVILKKANGGMSKTDLINTINK